MISTDFIIGLMMIVLSIIFIVMGILYLAKIGHWYNKLIEKKSETFARNLGIAFVVIGALLLIVGIISIYLEI